MALIASAGTQYSVEIIFCRRISRKSIQFLRPFSHVPKSLWNKRSACTRNVNLLQFLLTQKMIALNTILISEFGNLINFLGWNSCIYRASNTTHGNIVAVAEFQHHAVWHTHTIHKLNSLFILDACAFHFRNGKIIQSWSMALLPSTRMQVLHSYTVACVKGA